MIVVDIEKNRIEIIYAEEDVDDDCNIDDHKIIEPEYEYYAKFMCNYCKRNLKVNMDKTYDWNNVHKMIPVCPYCGRRDE